jgi:hypothetical protein
MPKPAAIAAAPGNAVAIPKRTPTKMLVPLPGHARSLLLFVLVTHLLPLQTVVLDE